MEYTGYQLLIQPKLVDSCSHMTLMHEKTLLIQPNFSSKKWRRVEKHIWSVVNASKNAFDPLSLLENNFDWLLEENTFDWLSIRIKYVFSTRRHFFEEKLGWIKSVFSCISVTWLHRPTGSNVGPPCILTATIGSQFSFNPPYTFRMRKVVEVTIISKIIHNVVDLSLATTGNSIADSIDCFHRWPIEIIIRGLFNADELVQMLMNRITRTVTGESLIDWLELNKSPVWSPW